MTLQQFLEKHKDFYLTALDNLVCLEVDCKKRNKYTTDEEESDLKTLRYVNVLSSTDYSMMCCGIASFKKEYKIGDAAYNYMFNLESEGFDGAFSTYGYNQVLNSFKEGACFILNGGEII